MPVAVVADTTAYLRPSGGAPCHHLVPLYVVFGADRTEQED